MRALLLLLLLVAAAAAQSPEELASQAKALADQGRTREAIALVERALQGAEQTLGPENAGLARYLGQLVGLYMAVGDYARAEPLVRRAVVLEEKALGPEHPQTGTALVDLGVCLTNQRKYAEAEPVLQRALAIREKTMGPEAAGTADVLGFLGDLERFRWNGARAEAHYVRALAIAEKAWGPEAPGTLKLLRFLAIACQMKGDNARAEALLQRALASSERTLGPDHRSTADNLLALALHYAAMGDYSRAEAMLTRVVAIRQKAFGPGHGQTAYALYRLGMVHEAKGDFPQAESLFLQALAIQEKALGPNHPDTAESLSTLAIHYYRRGDYVRAEPLATRAIAVQEKEWGPNAPPVADALDALARICLAKNDTVRAEALFGRALAIKERTQGPESRDAAFAAENLARVLTSRRDYARAESLLLRAVATLERILGPEHPDTATAYNNLADLYSVWGQPQKAEPLQQKAVAATEKALGPNHQGLGTCLANLAATCWALGNLPRALELYTRALAIHEKVLGPEHPLTALELGNLSMVCLESGQRDRALEYARRAAAADRKVAGTILACSSERVRLGFFQSHNALDVPATLGVGVPEAVLAFKGLVLDSLLEDREAAGPEFEALRKLRDQYSELPPERRGAVQAEIEKLEARLGGSVARHRALAITPEAVQKQLPPDAALIELVAYLHHDGRKRVTPRYGAVVFTSREARWLPLPSVREVDPLLDGYSALMRPGEAARATRIQTGPPRTSTDVAVLQKLYQALWDPIQKALPAGTRRVLISPDGRLNFLSFATLLDPQGRFLGESLDISYVSSGRDLLLPAPPPIGKTATLVYDPRFAEAAPALAAAGPPPAELRAASDLSFADLPGTRLEGEALARLLTSQGMAVEAWTGTVPDEAHLRSVRSPTILHLATHGFFLPENTAQGWNPMRRSGLALAGAQLTAKAWARGQAPDPAHDGILTAEEVVGLQLDHTWLATLSACDTGAGQSLSGEGVLGLRRAVSMAGAQNLLMTLWPVADRETADLMLDFYAAALKTGNAPAALAGAQRQWLAKLRAERGPAAAARLAGPFVLLVHGPLP